MSNKLINPTKKEKRQPFPKFVEQIPGLSEEATDALNDLVHASTETGKGGEVVIKIKMKPIAGKGGQMELETEVKTKLPTLPRGTTILFTTPDNNLSRQDPRQQTLDGVRDVSQESIAQQGGMRVPPAGEAGQIRIVGQTH